MPSGREIYTPKIYVLPCLDEDTVVRMRAPLDSTAGTYIGGDDSSDEEESEVKSDIPGTFPDLGPSESTYF